VKYLSCAPLWGRFLALPANTGLGSKGLPGTNTLAYNEHSSITVIKDLMALTPGLKNRKRG